MTKRVLVTGANGFVGRFVCEKMHEKGWDVKRAVRNPAPNSLGTVKVSSIDDKTDWSKALDGIDAVIHLAARVHVMKDTSSDPLKEFRLVNVKGSEKLARMAAAVGVKRFVHVSSIKVNGEATFGKPFTEKDEPKPQDPYGISKWEAEENLKKVAIETGLELAIIRPPLVYGPHVGGNFLRILNWVAKTYPLPLGAVKNKRSMVYVGNLADAISLCASHPKAASETFLVSDNETLSTPQIICSLAGYLGVPPKLWPIPVPLLHLAGKMTGKSAEIERLTGSLEVDCSKIRQLLHWVAPFSVEEGLADTVKWHMNRLSHSKP